MANAQHEIALRGQKRARRSMEQRIEGLSRYRVASHSVLVRVGLTEKQIRGRVAAGRLVRLYPGVYAVGPASLDDAGRFRAAVLAGGEGALLAGRAACAWWGMVEVAPDPVDVITPTHRRSRRGARFHCTPCAPDERTVRDGIPVVCPARAILDLAATIEGRSLERALNEVRVRRLPDRPSLGELIERYPGRHGIPAARAALALFLGGPTPTESDLEEMLLDLIDRKGLPRPLLNRRIRTAAGIFRVDCVWPEQRVIVEVDAWGTHSSRRSMIEDRRRDRALRIAGWHPSRLIWEDFADEDRLAGDLVRLLAAA